MKSHLDHLFVIAVSPDMPPDYRSTNGTIFNKDETPGRTEDLNENNTFKAEIVWRNVVYLSYFHLAALYGIYILFASARFATFLFGKYIF